MAGAVAADREPELDRYAAMRWNTPLSGPHAAELLERLDILTAASVLDIGCGWGELLLRAVALSQPQSGCRGIGVDTDLDLLTRGRMLAGDRGLEQRVRFVQAAAQTWTEPADRVLCIGATHAWGGTAAALVALRKLTRPGGRLLFGDGCWETQPTRAAADIFGDEVIPLASIIDHAQAANWRVLHLDTADQREWDEFESSWRQGREDWLRDRPDDTAAQAVRAELDARITEYVRDYRGVLGFCYAILSAS